MRGATGPSGKKLKMCAMGLSSAQATMRTTSWPSAEASMLIGTWRESSANGGAVSTTRSSNS
ncbi:hypothetical protein D3C81_1835350 [compost metagenome]